MQEDALHAELYILTAEAMLRISGIRLGHRMRTVRAVSGLSLRASTAADVRKRGEITSVSTLQGMSSRSHFQNPFMFKVTSDKEFFNVVQFLLSLAKKHFRKSSG